MAIGDYTKTTYVSGTAPGISADRLNNNEDKTNELDKAFAGLFPSGLICMWSGAVVAIPTGWNLCDGTNGTPDLRGKFILGAGGDYGPGDAGGEATHVLTEAEMPSHSHDVTVTGGSHGHTGSSGSAGNHSHAGTAASGGGHTHGYNDYIWPGASGSGNKYDSSSGTEVAEADIARTTASGGAHTHTIATNTTGSHSHTVTVNSASHTHTAAAGDAGSDTAHNNLPPYYALCYIMKL